jgi:HEAT repeat protein
MIRDEDLAQWPLPLGSDEELARTCSVEQLVELLASKACLVSYDTDPSPDFYGGPADIVHYAPAVAGRVLARIGAPAIAALPALIAAHARTKDADIAQAIIALMPFADRTSLRDLERFAEPKVRAALVPLGHLDALIRLARDPDTEVASKATLALARHDDERVLPALEAAHAHPHAEVRWAAARGLVKHAPLEVKLRVLHAELANSHPTQATFDEVGALGAPAAFCVNRLAELLMKHDRTYVLAALATLAPHARDQTAARRALASVFWRRVTALYEPAAVALATLRPASDPATSERVIAALPAVGLEIHLATNAIDPPLVIPALVALLSHTDGSARAGAAHALAIRAAKQALPALRAALERERDDFGWRSVHAAIVALERFRGDPPT